MDNWTPALNVRPTAPTRAAVLHALFETIARVLAYYGYRLGLERWAAVGWYLDRTRRRLLRLIERLENGTWRPSPKSKPRPDRVRKPYDRVRFPTRRGWLPAGSSMVMTQFTQLIAVELNRPETLALLAPAQAQAARLLRTLARMTNMHLAIIPKPEPRRRRPRARPRPPRLTDAERRDALHYRNAEGRPVNLLPPRRSRAK